jgi:hypothetical protein
VPDEEVRDGGGLLHRDQVRGAGYDGEAGVRDAGDQGAGLGGAGDLVVRADEDEGRHPDPAELGPYVERGQRLARGDVAAGVGGAHHLHGPLGDRGLRRGEAAGEPALGRHPGDGVEAVRAHDHAALPELVRRAEAGRGGDQRERGHPLRVAQRQFELRPRRRARSPRSRSAARRGRRAWPAAGRPGRRPSRPGARASRRGPAGRTGRPATASPARAPAGRTCARSSRATGPG